jgi:Mn-dependent DtxR family transcriptional regulator
MTDVNKTRVVTESSLLSQGYIEQDDNGIALTSKGYEVAYNRWMSLPEENRLLLGLFVKQLIWEHHSSKGLY